MKNRILKALLTLTVLPAGIAAQDVSANASVIQDARQKLNDLEYVAARNLASRVINAGEAATRHEKLQSMQLLAAAYFPEEDAAQMPDSATFYIRDMLTIAPREVIPSEISWPGLDNLVSQTRRSIFAAAAEPNNEYVLEGVDAEGRIPVVATRPTQFGLAFAPRGSGTRIVVDSTNYQVETSLSFKVAQFDRVLFSSGDYELWITARDSATGNVTEMAYAAVVDAPPISLVAVPMSMDSSQLLPETTRRNRLRNTFIGVGLGAVTGFIATAFRGSEPVSNVGLDNRAYVMGGAMTLGGVIGAFTDRAAPVPANIAHNAGIRADFAEYVRQSRDENARRRISYRATVTIGEILNRGPQAAIGRSQ